MTYEMTSEVAWHVIRTHWGSVQELEPDSSPAT